MSHIGPAYGSLAANQAKVILKTCLEPFYSSCLDRSETRSELGSTSSRMDRSGRWRAVSRRSLRRSIERWRPSLQVGLLLHHSSLTLPHIDWWTNFNRTRSRNSPHLAARLNSGKTFRYFVSFHPTRRNDVHRSPICRKCGTCIRIDRSGTFPNDRSVRETQPCASDAMHLRLGKKRECWTRSIFSS